MFTKKQWDDNAYEKAVIFEVSEPLMEGTFSMVALRNSEFDSQYFSFEHKYISGNGKEYLKKSKFFRLNKNVPLTDILTAFRNKIDVFLKKNPDITIDGVVNNIPAEKEEEEEKIENDMIEYDE